MFAKYSIFLFVFFSHKKKIQERIIHLYKRLVLIYKNVNINLNRDKIINDDKIINEFLFLFSWNKRR